MTALLRSSLLAAATLAALALGHVAVRADGTSCTAYVSGLETSRRTPAEVVVFNATPAPVTLDLRLLDAAGATLLERPGGVEVGPYATTVVSLEAELSRDLPKKARPYEGLVAVDLTGAAPFAEDTVLVHATQYYGKRKKPRGAVVFRALYRVNE